jgi:multidrug efflux pump subunit AcrB
MRDVAWIHNGYEPQTSFVRENGTPSVLLTVIKNGAFSTITIVDQVKQAIPRIKAGLPSALTITPLFDQSILVKASVRDVVQEGITAARSTVYGRRQHRPTTRGRKPGVFRERHHQQRRRGYIGAAYP